MATRIEGHCEAKKHSYRQVQDGVIISFVVHPNDVSPALAAAPLGTVFMLGYAEVTGEETAAQEAPQKERRPFHELPLPTQAGILCAEPSFQKWMGFPGDEGDTTLSLRMRCQINSRAELATNEGAAGIFAAVVEKYRRDTGRETWTP